MPSTELNRSTCLNNAVALEARQLHAALVIRITTLGVGMSGSAVRTSELGSGEERWEREDVEMADLTAKVEVWRRSAEGHRGAWDAGARWRASGER
jgi:hypothetical protein